MTADPGYAFWVKGPTGNNIMAGGVGDAAYVEGTSQVYKRGAPVYRSSGKVVVSVVTSHLISALGIEGFANVDASGVADTPAPITKLVGGDFWAIPCYDDGVAKATAESMLNTFVNFDVINPSTGVYYLVTNDNALDVAKPGGYIREIWTPEYGYLQSPYAVGDVGAYVVVEIATAAGTP